MNQHIPEGEVPDEIKLVNEFLNTLDLERFGPRARMPEAEREEFRTTEGLRVWLVERGLLDAGEPVTESDRELAIAVRNVLRDAARTNDGGETVDHRTFAAANDVLGGLPLYLRLGERVRPELSPGSNGVRRALGHILANVAIAAASGTWRRLKICNASDCQWAYYDHSKSRTSRWCAMETCGNRHKTRRYRQRQKLPSGNARK